MLFAPARNGTYRIPHKGAEKPHDGIECTILPGPELETQQGEKQPEHKERLERISASGFGIMKHHAIQENYGQSASTGGVIFQQQVRCPEQNKKQTAIGKQCGHPHGKLVVVVRDYGEEELDPQRIKHMVIRG